MDQVREAIAAGRPTFGSWLSIADPIAAELLGRAGFDWVIADAQHGGVNWQNLLPVLQAVQLGGTPTLVRVGWNDPKEIMRALDLGAIGVVVPMVSTADEARAAVAATRFPPAGIRSFGPVRTGYASGGAGGGAPLCLVMIETAEALQNLEAIAATPSLDGVFVGPVDLALSLGLGAALTMPDAVMEAIDQVIRVCRKHDLISGGASLGAANAKALMERGLQFVTVSSDVGLIRRGAAAEVAAAQEWIAALAKA